MERSADMEAQTEDVKPQHCFNCKSLVSWIPQSQALDATTQCEKCRKLPSTLEVSEAHLEQVRELRNAGELGEQYHFCWTCEEQPCQCRRCLHCGARNAPRWQRCVHCNVSTLDTPLWYDSIPQTTYCDDCRAPEDDCHCEDQDDE